MCRLLGYVAHTPRTIVDVVGEGEFEHFRHLARTHSDGWGAAWRDDDAVTSVCSLTPADDSDRFRAFAAHHAADASIVHLRRATQGLAVSAENLHPFTHGEVAFAHNGSVIPPASIDAIIPADAALTRRGDTDSERLYCAITARMHGEQAMSPADALADTLRAVDEQLAYTSLNCMLLTPDQLIVACLFREGTMRELAEFEQAADYYEMRYRADATTVVASSSGWPQDGWSPLHNGEVLTVDRSTLATSITALRPSVAHHG